MPTYKYQVRLPDGRMQGGIVEAPNPDAASEALVERNYEILSLEPYRGSEAASRSLTAFLNRVSSKELVAAIRMLSVMISASVPLVDAVRNLYHQTKNPRFKEVLADVANEIEGGAKLSDAVEKYPKVFSAFFVNMIRAGETTGQLAEVMLYLADQQEKDFDLLSKLRGALMYPIFIVCSMLAVGFIVMTYVVPKLTAVLKESGTELPLTTKMLIMTSDFMALYWWVIILGVVVFSTAFYYWIQTPYGRYQWDWIKLKIPIFGTLFQYIYVVRFCQSMSTLMSGGVTLVQALEIAASVMGNAVWKNLILQTIEAVNDGQPLTTAFAKSKEVPSMVVQMLSVGEETGKLNDILKRLSDFYSRQVANMSAGMLTLIEPVIMVILGLAVGVMVSAIMLPMYNMSSGA